MLVDIFTSELSHEKEKGWDRWKNFIGRDVFNLNWADVLEGTKKNQLIEKLLIEEIEKNGKEARRKMKQQIHEMAYGLTTCCSPTLLYGAYTMAERLGRHTFSGMYIDETELDNLRATAKKAAAEGKSLILLPSHKSHIDYMALHYLYLKAGISVPMVAAGNNLELPLIGRLLKRSGAFFIRRSFGGEDGKVYTQVVAAFMEELLKRGINIEFFPEGGRSRTGKLLVPKIGMLSMVITPILKGLVRDAYIVPISIQYDRLMEGAEYAHELLGSKKQKESVSGLFGAVKEKLTYTPRMGSIQIRIAEGFSVAEYIKNRMLTDTLSRRGRVMMLRSIAYRVLDDINKVSCINPTSLVGTVMLTTRGRGVGREELIRKVEWLRDMIEKSGGNCLSWPDGHTADMVDESLKVMSGLIGTHQLLQPVYSVSNHLELSFYRNLLCHVFMERSTIVAALHSFMRGNPNNKFVTRQQLMERTGRLSRILRSEFVFAGATGRMILGGKRKDANESALAANFRAALDHLVAHKILELDENDNVKLFTTDSQLWSAEFTFLCMLIWPFIESYWLVLAGLLTVFSKGRTHSILQEGVFISQLQSFGLMLFHLGDLNFYESLSKESLAHALSTYREFGAIEKRVIQVSGTDINYMSLGEKYHSEYSRLLDLEDEIRGFRRMGRFQKELEAFPEEVARVAFQPQAKL